VNSQQAAAPIGSGRSREVIEAVADPDAVLAALYATYGPILTAGQIAGLIGIAPATVYHWSRIRKAGFPRPVRLGREYRWWTEEYAEWRLRPPDGVARADRRH